MRRRAAAAALLAALLVAAAPAAAAPREPRFTVARGAMVDAITCWGPISRNGPAPILYATGTGADGSQVYVLGRGAFDAIGHPVCTVSFPDRTTADVQDSVQYLVFAIRALARAAGKPITVAGVSQGGLLIRVALTYWPSLRPHVADAVMAAATHHGSVGSAESTRQCLTEGCPPAMWQQARRARFLAALNDGRDETPGKVAYTTVRSATDTNVRPQTGRHPTSALEGARNILIQDVCPGRTTGHVATAVDSVTIAALADAIAHKGPAKPSRLPPDVCDHPYGTGLDEAQTTRFLELVSSAQAGAVSGLPVVRSEPKVRAWVKR